MEQLEPTFSVGMELWHGANESNTCVNYINLRSEFDLSVDQISPQLIKSL